ncbi:MAG TPA: hypothetical protein VNH11_13390 [Pirellulales bacterium]|nr:hypothetical protein [Pirellulales bacterium]
MKIQKFLEHHGIAANPFAEEDAQTDAVFKEFCIDTTHHPTWDKVYGDPSEPSTAIVFGEKGAGKTAMRLQIVRHVEQYNRQHADSRLFVIEYDDFNPFLDRFHDKLGRRRRLEQVLSYWKLWDHMDAILSLGVTQLVDRLLDKPHPLPPGPQAGAPGRGEGDKRHRDAASPAPALDPRRLDRTQMRDLLLLAAIYDQSTAENFRQRWHRLRRRLRFHTWRTRWPLALGIVTVLVVFGLIVGLQKWDWLASPWPYVFAAAGWIPLAARSWKWYWRARAIMRQLRVVNHEPNPLRQVLMNFSVDELAGQPLPTKERTDDRFELLAKFQGVLRTLGFSGIIVLVDRVDEPHLINGSPEQMKALLWPMLDNKFLKHPGIGFKLLLPIELSYFADREAHDFYQRARLDKQNLVRSLGWTGEALYDVANARLKACAINGQTPSLRTLFQESVSERRLIDALRTLRVPRHLFKFLHRLFVSHANAYTDENPSWQISGETFESVLALYQREQDAYDRGLG